MQKRFITVLVALTLPLAGLMAGSGSDNYAWAADKSDKVDVNAGASADGGLSTDTPATGSGMSSGDNNSGADATGGTTPPGTPPADGEAAPATTNTTGAPDASLDSIWSEQTPPAGKSKSSKKKSKTKSKSKSQKVNSNSGADPTGGTTPGADKSSDLTPAPPTSSGTTQPSTTSTVPAGAGGNFLPSDFGAYPAAGGAATPGATGASTSTTTSATTSATATSTATPTTPAATSLITTPATTAAGTPSATSTSSSAPDSTAPAASAASKADTAAASTAASESPEVTTPAATAPAANPAPVATTPTFSSHSSNKNNPPVVPVRNYTAYGVRIETPKIVPLCAAHTFFQSELVRTVSWPGIGPFKGDSDPNYLADPQENKLTLQTEGDKLTSAELFLLHQPGNPQGFINLQMVMDFMLEAIGARDKKISDLNAFLEKNKAKLIKKKGVEEKPLTTSAGAYLVSIEQGSSTNNDSSYLIQIKSKVPDPTKYYGPDAVNKMSEETPPTKTKSQATNIASNIQSVKPANDITRLSVTKDATTVKEVKPAKETKPDKTTKLEKEIKTEKEVKEVKVEKEAKQEPPKSGKDSLKQEFVDTIKSWQSIKKTAVKNQDTSELSKVLSGKALDKQTVAIGWLVKKKDYYELNPKGVTVDHYEELSQSPKRYAVFAQVKESSKLMDQTTGKQLSENDDQYNVKYTIERADDHWVIYDSDLIKTTTPTGDQSKNKSKSKH